MNGRQNTYIVLKFTVRQRRIKMARLKVGDKAPRTNTTAIDGSPVTVPGRNNGLVHVQFRRFAGCPVCNFHLISMARRVDEVHAAGIRQVVFFHSSAQEMRKYQAQLPFSCVADPAKQYYRAWGVETSLGALFHLRVLINGARWVLGQRRFYRKAENGVFGLPADFLVDAQGVIVACKYGQHADDQWDVDNLLQAARGVSEGPPIVAAR